MELSKNYDPAAIEEKWTRHWKSKDYFSSRPDNRPPFTVVIPPPNVTGVLHMGHTLNETVQDILVRRARMSGFNACWVPGSDHASIATEAKVVEMLRKEKNIDKSSLSREEFLSYAFEWKEKYGNIIYGQIEKLGCSVDWNRAAFTMDADYYRAVVRIFVRLYNEGLIYRGARMINWDVVAKTALSDEEVEHRDLPGKLYYVKYFIVDTPDSVPGSFNEDSPYVVIATQRPETIMGDTAVCVHPDDARYEWLHGKYAVIPFVDRVVPVITDTYIDREFGTGVLKVTPAHDINDYNIGLKHKLEVIETLHPDGTLTAAGAQFAGLERFEARKQVAAALREKGWLVKEEENDTRAGFSQRTNSVVEPRISTQWFVSTRALADQALSPVLDGRITIFPLDRFTNTYRNWLTNIKDWCISRQLWWGQRIPAWYDGEGRFVVAENATDAATAFEQKFGAPKTQLRQDEDVLDTWFSSWLWPIEVFKGITDPGNEDHRYYYPTSVLVTGQDIIFFWVARMIMAGMHFEGQIPFPNVYFTGMVRDKQGRKMSKSLGNSPDLLDLIAKYGADAVRFGIMIASPAGNDLLFDDSSPEQGRNFNNKLWNALKLVKMWEEKLQQGDAPTEERSGQQAVEVFDVSGFAGTTESDADEDGTETVASDFAVKWFAHRLAEARLQIDALYTEFKISEVLKTIYSLIWDDFCSWYLEWVKPAFGTVIDSEIHRQTIAYFADLLHLLHPFMPFITEEIYHLLDDRQDDLTVRQYLPVAAPNVQVLEAGRHLQQVITSLRDTRVKSKLKNKDDIKLYVITETPELYMSFYHILSKQVNANAIAFNTEAIGHNTAVVIGKDKFFLETAAPIDNSEQSEGLEKELKHLEGFLLSVHKKLENERFLQNARPEVIALEQKKKSDTEARLKIIRESLANL